MHEHWTARKVQKETADILEIFNNLWIFGFVVSHNVNKSQGFLDINAIE